MKTDFTLKMPNVFNMTKEITKESFYESFIFENDNLQIEYNELEEMICLAVTKRDDEKVFEVIEGAFDLSTQESKDILVCLFNKNKLSELNTKERVLKYFKLDMDSWVKLTIQNLNSTEKEALLYGHVFKLLNTKEN